MRRPAALRTKHRIARSALHKRFIEAAVPTLELSTAGSNEEFPTDLDFVNGFVYPVAVKLTD